jgi:hypothetical protein
MEKRMARTKLHPAIKSVTSSDHKTVRMLNWFRDGDQHVAAINGHEARITPWNGPLGNTFSVSVDGKAIGHIGGGTDALARAKRLAEDKLANVTA